MENYDKIAWKITIHSNIEAEPIPVEELKLNLGYLKMYDIGIALAMKRLTTIIREIVALPEQKVPPR